MSAVNIPPPEQYFLPPTDHCPNNSLPLLVYRNALPAQRKAEEVQAWIETHGWARQGNPWPAVYRRHFHPNVHECYAVLSGSSQVLMGVGKLDDTDNPSASLGLLLTLREGDVIVHPAGTGHSNFTADDDYRFVAFFPKGVPKWITHNGDKPLEELPEVWDLIKQAPMPTDPVLGGNGHLVPIWSAPKNGMMQFQGVEGRPCPGSYV